MDNKSHGNMMKPDDTPELRQLYADFEAEHLMPLWTQIDDIMPLAPKPKAVPHIWKWSRLFPLAERSGELVPVGRGGERRAIGLANPGLGGKAYVSPTLWAAIQYLGPRDAPSTGTRKTPFASSWKGRAYRPSSTATPSHEPRRPAADARLALSRPPQ